MKTYQYVRKDAKEYLSNQPHLIRVLFVSSVVAMHFTGIDCGNNNIDEDKRLITYLLLCAFKTKVFKKFFTDNNYKHVKSVLDSVNNIIGTEILPDNFTNKKIIKKLTSLLYTFDYLSNFMQNNNDDINLFIGENEAAVILFRFIVDKNFENMSSKNFVSILSRYSYKLYDARISLNKKASKK